MEEKEKNNQFKNATTTDNTTYKSFNFNKKEKTNPSSFGKTVLLPFACGILGAGIVLGTCFGVPGIRNTLLKTESNDSVSTSTTSTSSGQINTTQISLEEYSATGIGVAQKILPSIVGIR